MPSPVRRIFLACPWTLAVVALVLAEPALAANGGVAPPEPASPHAEWIRDVYWLVLGVSAVIFVLVEAALIFFVLRFRGRGRPREAEGPQIIGHRRLELAWTVVPVLILIVITGFTFYKLPGINDTPTARAAADTLRIRVEGRQFYWRYVYPNGRVSVNELRVPVDRVVELALTAPSHDVIHSWWVPALAGKKDVVPGEVNHLWFEVNRPGLYRGQCGEFCGDQHALMHAQVRAVPATDYETWVGEEQAGLGEQTWQGACGPCHGEQAQGQIGPPLAGTSLDPEQIEEVVRNGRGAMPAVGKGWDEAQVRALIRYIQSEFGAEQGAQAGG
jgi:cytochrome c oxidase subunit 2